MIVSINTEDQVVPHKKTKNIIEKESNNNYI
jgi:hypothetical protein